MDDSKAPFIIGGVALAVIVGAVATVIAFNGGESTTNPGGLKDPVTADDWTKGNENSEVVLVEYGDYQCPACASRHPFIEEVMDEMGDDVKLAYRHYPLTQHTYAIPAAISAEAAGKQGQFWGMHDLLYTNQAIWSASEDPEAEFESYAEDLGLDMEQYRSDIEDPALRDAVMADQASGQRALVSGTPAFYLNGAPLISNGEDDFKSQIQAAIDGAN